jgi:hypothetical protein
MGDGEAALAYSRQGLHLARETGTGTGFRDMEAGALTVLGDVLAEAKQWTQAVTAYREAADLFRALGLTNLSLEPLAGLARVASAQGTRQEADSVPADEGTLAQAQGYVEEILAYLEGGGSAEGTDEPLRIYLTCYQVLKANHDPRAQNLLTIAHELLQERAANILDAGAQRSFLENVPYHRAILDAFAAQQ